MGRTDHAQDVRRPLFMDVTSGSRPACYSFADLVGCSARRDSVTPSNLSNSANLSNPELPTRTRPARELFGIDSDLQVPVFDAVDERVPPRDPDYVFDRDTTLALLAGFV